MASLPEHRALAEELVAEAHARDGLAPVDLDRFWADNKLAAADPFGRDIPQVALGPMASDECVFAELGVAEDWDRYHHDPAWMNPLIERYNDKAKAIVGREVLGPRNLDPLKRPARVRQLYDIFEAENVFHHESYWLKQSADSPDGLRALLDRVDARLEHLRDFLLPEDWEDEKARCTANGVPLPHYGHQRGPVTFACSIFGPENLIFLLLDEPDLGARLRDTMLKAMVGMRTILDEEAGFAPGERRGFSFADDNCCLLTAELYEFFAYPILKDLWDRYSPDPGDTRYQHSDSAMGHLLPVLSKLDLTGTNFGPTVTVEEIRAHLPRAVIHGQLAPFTYSRNDEVGMVAEFLRDFHGVGDTRGLRFTTAGSINNGSRLTGMRLIMAAIQRWGRYR